MRRVLIALAAIAFFVTMQPPATGAATTSTDNIIQASPKCSGTHGHGKILYQACFRYNCDSANCNVLGYLGLINTATSARTVTWELEQSLSSGWVPDDRGQVTLAAGEQRTIFSKNPGRSRCGISASEALRIMYDSTGWASWIGVTDFMSCV